MVYIQQQWDVLRGGQDEEYAAVGGVSTYVVLCRIWDYGDFLEQGQWESGRKSYGCVKSYQIRNQSRNHVRDLRRMEIDIIIALLKMLSLTMVLKHIPCVFAFLEIVPRQSPSTYAHSLQVGLKRALCTYGVSLPCEGCGGYSDG